MLKLITITLLIFSLISCSAVDTAISKRKLDVETKMSSTIFLDPVTKDKQTIFLQYRNTSDQNIEIKNKLIFALEEKNYKIVENIAKANFLLQINVLQAGKTDPIQAQQFLASGYGKMSDLAALSALGAYSGSRHSNGYAMAGGLLGAGISIDLML